MKFLNKSQVALVGRFWGEKRTFSDIAAVYANLGMVCASSLVERNSLKSSRIWHIIVPIKIVLCIGCLAQVAKAIVRGNSINVVNEFFRPDTMDVEPSQPMYVICLPKNTYRHIPICHSPPSSFRLSVLAGRKPIKIPSVRVIMKHFTQMLLREGGRFATHGLGRSSVHIRLAIKSLLGALTPSRLAICIPMPLAKQG